MQALGVVEAHVVGDVAFGAGAIVVTLGGRPFGFETAEESFHDRVVPAVAAPAHALRDAIVTQLAGESFARVLGALIGMEEQSGRSTSAFPGLIKGFQNQVAVRTLRTRPAYDPSRKQIHYHGQIHPTASGCDVSDVAGPDLVGSGRLKLPIQTIGHNSVDVVGTTIRRTASLSNANIGLVHQRTRPATPDRMPTLTQLCTHPPTTIAVSRLVMDLPYLVQQGLIGAPDRAPFPRVETTARHFDHPAYLDHRKRPAGLRNHFSERSSSLTK